MKIEKINIDETLFSYCDKENSRIYFGFGSYMNRDTVYEYISQIMRNNPGYQVPPNLVIEFIPTFHITGKPSFSEWMDTNKHSSDAETAFKEFAMASQKPEAQKAMDAYWEGHEFNKHANLYMLPVIQYNKTYSLSKEDITSHMYVPQDVQKGIRESIEKEYGKGNVYVANQIQPLQNIVKPKYWHFFLRQGSDALYDGIIYNRTEFDDQLYHAGEMIIPVGVIPVTIKRGEISRHVNAAALAREYKKTMQYRVNIPQMSDYSMRVVGCKAELTALPLWDKTYCNKNLSMYIRQFVSQIKKKCPSVYEKMLQTHQEQLFTYAPPSADEPEAGKRATPLTLLFRKVVSLLCRK